MHNVNVETHSSSSSSSSFRVARQSSRGHRCNFRALDSSGIRIIMIHSRINNDLRINRLSFGSKRKFPKRARPWLWTIRRRDKCHCRSWRRKKNNSRGWSAGREIARSWRREHRSFGRFFGVSPYPYWRSNGIQMNAYVCRDRKCTPRHWRITFPAPYTVDTSRHTRTHTHVCAHQASKSPRRISACAAERRLQCSAKRCVALRCQAGTNLFPTCEDSHSWAVPEWELTKVEPLERKSAWKT